jgi:hypothetical protein
MIRTIWLATICLAVLGTLAFGKAVMMRAYSSATGQPADQTTVGIDLTQNTLGKADRLELTYVHQEMPAASALQPAEPVVPAVASVPTPTTSQIIGRHWHDPDATKLKQAKQTTSNNKSKTDNRKSNQAADRAKPAESVKPCSRPGSVGDLLRSLNLSPACES